MSGKKAKLLRRETNKMAKPINLFGKKNATIPGLNGIPMQAGPAQQKINLSPSDISFKACLKCGHEFFDIAYRNGVFSALNPKNPTGKDQPVNVPVFLCRACGWEYGVKEGE